MKGKEVSFLGYEFSSNRSKTGISIKDKSMLIDIAPIMNEFINTGTCNIKDDFKENVQIKYLDEIILNVKNDYVGDIYPKYSKVNGVALNKYCVINNRTESEYSTKPIKYIEISDLNNLPNSSKKKTTTRFCKKGDILISSLCPKKTHIVISDGDYMLSTAIHVLSGFENDSIRKHVYNQLKTANVLQQINTMLDGFKITYAKISDENLLNNVFIEEKK